MDHEQIRRTVIVAAFTDPFLSERLVVKGGNALRLVHQIGRRTSLDVDFSTPDELDLAELSGHLYRALMDRFDAAGLLLFDFKLERRPSRPRDPLMTGYKAIFKVIEKSKANGLGNVKERLQREAATIGPAQQRNFVIEISEHEFCEGAEERELDHFVVRAYTPTMIAVEKYRAICQQNPKYTARPNKTSRARDFFDIHSILTSRGIDLGAPDCHDLFRSIFGVKEVPLDLLQDIEGQRDFHRQDWPSVQQSVAGSIESFDFYFDFTLARAPKL